MERSDFSEDAIDNAEDEKTQRMLDIEDFGENDAKQLPKELYHYTSWETFNNIVNNHTWRFSSINGTNDLSEDLNLYVRQLLNDKKIVKVDSNIKNKIIHNIKTDNFYGTKSYFIACFSEEKDDLGQWRTSYGDYGRGVCIGINPKFFTKHMYLENSDMLGWVKVSYDIQTQKQRLSKIVSKLEKPDPIWGMDNTTDLTAEIRDKALTMKHKAFHIEHEWRMIVAMVGDTPLDDNFHSLSEDLEKPEEERQYFIRNANPNIQGNFIVRCMDYDLDSKAREGEGNLFTSILLGKECPHYIEDAKEALTLNEFNTKGIKFSKSNIPYRFSDDREKIQNT